VLERQADDALQGAELLRMASREKAGKDVQGAEPGVARGDRVLAVGLEEAQKSRNRRTVDQGSDFGGCSP